MKVLRVIFCCIGIIISYRSGAQELLTPEEAIATALQNNYDIRLSKNDSTIYAIDYSYANAAFIPTISGQGGLIFNNNNQKQKLADGTDRKAAGVKSKNTSSSLNLDWVLFDGLKMFVTRNKYKEYVSLGDLIIKNQVTDIVANVVTTYYNIVRQKQSLKAIEELMVLNRARLQLAEVKLEVGLGIKPDVLQAKVDLNAQISAQYRQQTLIQQQKENLNRLMAVNKGVEYEVQDSIPIDSTLLLNEVASDLENSSPVILLSKKNIDIARLTLKERKAERWPVVAFQSAYNFNQTNNNSVVNPFSPLYSQNRGFNYGLTATVPIFNNYVTKRNIKQAQADINFQTLTLENQLSILNTNIINAYREYDFQKRALALEEANIGLAKENVNIAYERYKLAVTTFIELRDAQQSLQQAYDRLIAARYDTKVAETELLRLRGEFIKKR
ncbi:MAG: TolC family protein [Ginsengibacter sp.]